MEVEVKTITSINEIINRLREDGDLRECSEKLDAYGYTDEDDIGFYQQACEYMIKIINAMQKQVIEHDWLVESTTHMADPFTLVPFDRLEAARGL
jgi:hypothetical protein